jgi:hypothetical protein
LLDVAQTAARVKSGVRMRVAAGLTALLVVGALVGAAPRAHAQNSEVVKSLAGAWEISNADHDKRCATTLKADTTPGGYKLEFDKAACAADFPPLKDVMAWNLGPAEAVRLVDARGRAIYEFTEVESGTYESLRPGQPLTFLQSAAVAAATAVTRTSSPQQMSGDWNVVRGLGATICSLTLTTTPSGGDMALRLKPGCGPLVSNFGPTTWQIDRGELVLKSPRGQSWRFEENEGAWLRVPEGVEPLALVRQ